MNRPYIQDCDLVWTNHELPLNIVISELFNNVILKIAKHI
jgi:hypothetical protein